MSITPDEQAALERLRIVLIGGQSLAGVYAGRIQNIERPTDREIVCRLALREHPSDDDCDLTRLELIEELDAARESINAMGTLLSHYQTTTTCDEQMK